MNSPQIAPAPAREPFVDAREAAYIMNLPLYYLINAAQRDKQQVPYYRIGKMVRFKLSELEAWQQRRHGAPEVAHE